MRKSVFIAALLAAAMPIVAQQSRETVCEACEQAVLETDSTICRLGYGCGKTPAEADSIAMSNARGELVNLLRDSVAAICYKVAVVRNAEEEYLEYQLFRDKAGTKRFFFANEGILAETPVVCQNRYQDGDNRYHSCCVLAARRKELNRGANIIMFEILQMSMFF